MLDSDLLASCVDIVTTTGDDERNHARADGWHSHGVLVKLFDRFMPPVGRLLDRPLPSTSFNVFAADEKCLRAIVNHGNLHWTAIVKPANCVWHVNSQTWPVLLTEHTYQKLLEHNPFAFVFVRNDFDE